MLRQITSLTDIEAIEKTPLNTLNLANNTYDVFSRSATKYPDKLALRFLFTGKVDEASIDYTYQQLHQRITQTANAFSQLGVTKEDIVSILLPNLPQTHFALWGAEAAGIANPINPLLEAEHIIGIMNAAKSKVLVTVAPFPKMNLWEKALEIAKHVPTLKAILYVNLAQFISPAPASPEVSLESALHIEDFDRLISQQPSTHLVSQRIISANDVACYFHTGGTTGIPKLAIHTHFNQVFSAWMVARQLHWTAEDVMHCGLPLFHVNAPLISGLAPFTVGGEVILTSPQGFRSDTVLLNFWKLVERFHISFFMGVPTIYRALSNTWTPEVNTTSLKFAACGAAPMPTALIDEFKQRTNISIVEGYGLTEGTVFSAVNPAFGERRVGSIGLRIPYQEMKAVKLDEQGNYLHDCAVEEIGNIVIRGPNVFKGYLNTQSTETNWIQDNWFNTGDLGRQDKDGYFWLTGRSKDLIIRGGHNIDPRLIEEALSKHPSVAMVAVVGKPHVKLGELPVAYITLREGCFVDENELLAFAKQSIPEKAAIPANIYVIQEMPVTAVGKIYKPALRYDAIKRVFDEALTTLAHRGMQYDIHVQADSTHGQVVKIAVKANSNAAITKDEVEAAIHGYTVKTDLQGPWH